MKFSGIYLTYRLCKDNFVSLEGRRFTGGAREREHVIWKRMYVYVCSLVITCLGRADLLTLLCVMFHCVLSLSRMVTRVRLILDFIGS